MTLRILCHVVTYNNADTVVHAVRSLLEQKLEGELVVQLTDNASSDGTLRIVRENFDGEIGIFANSENLGFSAAHNQGVARFLSGPFDLLFLANPDLRLEPKCLQTLATAIGPDPKSAMATPKLYRADLQLNPVEPKTFDACGMILDRTLRHFDRGSGVRDGGEYSDQEYVFGGTGAALMLKRKFVEGALLRGSKFESDLFEIYPELQAGAGDRAPLFDEAFFAYREDADLAWRAETLGWKTLFVPGAIGYHTRVVLPERRSALPAKINSWSIRNRFLMQLQNYDFSKYPSALVPGVIMRNLIVVLGVLAAERSSIQGLKEAWKLRKRALERRQITRSRAQELCLPGASKHPAADVQ